MCQQKEHALLLSNYAPLYSVDRMPCFDVEELSSNNPQPLGFTVRVCCQSVPLGKVLVSCCGFLL